MTTYSHLPNRVILAIGMLVVASISCHFEAREDVTIIYEQHYSIDPSVLLVTVVQNDESPFTPVEDRPELPPPAQQITVNWKQADYMRIVNALFMDIWGETTDGWLLKSMDFALGCTKIDSGFQDASFQYFRNEKAEEQESRVVRFVQIDPRSKSVYVEERIYSPRLVDWDSVDMPQLQFSADDVLALAESNGGKEKRLAVKNVCDITLLISPDPGTYQGWKVRYSNSDVVNLFDMRVDPITGEIDLP